MRNWIDELPPYQRECTIKAVEWECIPMYELYELACKFYGYSPNDSKDDGEVIKILEFADNVEGEKTTHDWSIEQRDKLETVNRLTRERWEEVDRTKSAYTARLEELEKFRTHATNLIETLTEQRNKAEAASTKPTALYRQFNASGDLLYIGIALDPFKRLLQHHRGSEWTSEQMTMTTEWYPSRQAALRAEKAAIIAESPSWNIVHNQEKAA